MKQPLIQTALVLTFLLLTGCRTHTIADSTSSEKETTLTELHNDSTSQKKEATDSVRWITRTKDSVNVYRMIILTQDSCGNTIATHDIERTYEWHGTQDSTAAYRKQLEAIVSERNALRDSLLSQKQTTQQEKEKTNCLAELAAKIFPITALLLALSITLNVILIRRKLPFTI